MTLPTPSRRDWLLGAGAAAGVALCPVVAAQDQPAAAPYRYCLNTSTISGQKLPLVQVVEIAGKAGYQGIEPWMRDLDAYVKSGGDLKDLSKRIRDQGLTVEGCIDFCEWIVDDDERRKQALEAAKRTMDVVRRIGGRRMAAPPVGATKQTDLNLLKAADRYRALCDLGAALGVTPQAEMWGFSTTLSRLGECAVVAVESGHPQACILPDVYHFHKGGSPFAGLRLLNGNAVPVFHMNDYPAAPARAEITDAHRVYPGDGVAPFKEIFRDLRAIGFQGVLSLELFNREYWKQDALVVARTGLEKMRAVVTANQS